MFKIILSIGIIQVLAVFIQFIKSKVTAVYLGPAGVGVIGTIDQFLQFVAFSVTFGITDSATKFLSKAHSKGQKEFKNSYASFFKLLLLLSVAGSVVAVGLVLWRADILGEELEKYRLFLILALITVPTYILGLFFVRVFAAAQQYNSSAQLMVITNAVSAIAIIVGVVFAGLLGFYLGNVVANIALTIGVVIYLWKYLGLSLLNHETNIAEQVKENPDIVSFTTMFYLAAVANSFSFLAARYSIITNFGEAEAGLLHCAIASSLLIGLILNPAVKNYFTPIINRDVEKAVKIRQSVEFQKKMIILLSIAALPIVLFPHLILTIMFSTKFAVVGDTVFLFVISQFIFQLTFINLTLLIGTDDLKSYALIYISGQLFFALLCLLLAPRLGIKGVAYGHIISGSLMFFLTLLRLVKEHKFPLSFNIWALLGYALSILFFAGLVCSRIEEWDIFISLLKIAFFILFASGFFIFLNAEEKESIYNFRSKILFGRRASR